MNAYLSARFNLTLFLKYLFQMVSSGFCDINHCSLNILAMHVQLHNIA